MTGYEIYLKKLKRDPSKERMYDGLKTEHKIKKVFEKHCAGTATKEDYENAQELILAYTDKYGVNTVVFVRGVCELKNSILTQCELMGLKTKR